MRHNWSQNTVESIPRPIILVFHFAFTGKPHFGYSRVDATREYFKIYFWNSYFLSFDERSVMKQDNEETKRCKFNLIRQFFLLDIILKT